MAKTKDTKLQFIELRAEGLSYAKIAERLHVAKSTLQDWERELNADIAERREEREQEMYSLYGMTREARIKRVGDTLTRINAALDEKDFSEMSADRLLTMKLQYERALREDYKEPTTAELPDFDQGELLASALLLLEAQQRGDVGPREAKQQFEIIKFLYERRTAYDDSDPFNFNIQAPEVRIPHQHNT